MLSDQLPEIQAVDEFRHQVQHAAFFARVQRADDVGMVQSTDREHLALKAAYGLPIPQRGLGQHFQGDHLVQQRLPGWARTLLYVLLYLSISVGGSYDNRPFIYFQF